MYQHESWVKSLSIYSENGTEVLLTGQCNGSIMQWAARSGEPIGKPILGHTAGINQLVVIPKHNMSTIGRGSSSIGGGNLLISASDDTTVRIWNLKSLLCTHILHGHSGCVTSVLHRVTGNKLEIISGSFDRTVCYWEVDLE